MSSSESVGLEHEQWYPVSGTDTCLTSYSTKHADLRRSQPRSSQRLRIDVAREIRECRREAGAHRPCSTISRAASGGEYSSSGSPPTGKARCRPISNRVLAGKTATRAERSRRLTQFQTDAQQAAQTSGVQGGHKSSPHQSSPQRATPSRNQPASPTIRRECCSPATKEGSEPTPSRGNAAIERLHQNEKQPRSGLDRRVFFFTRAGLLRRRLG